MPTPVLTAAEMREVDRETIELGIPGAILMENAGHRVVEYLQERYSPLSDQRIVVMCGKGNNGGDGYVIARQLHTRFEPGGLWVLSVFGTDQASEARRMLEATGCFVIEGALPAEARMATLVIDAVLGTGISGPARGPALEAIASINSDFPLADVIAVDLPSGMNSDRGETEGAIARAAATITFTAMKRCHALPPNCDQLGDEFRVTQIGSPSYLLDKVNILLSEPATAAALYPPRMRESNKGTYGHVYVLGGADGKYGAVEMTGLAALRAGAGLVTVASDAPRLNTLELMTETIPASWGELSERLHRKTVLAIGPGLGGDRNGLVVDAVLNAPIPIVVDADGLNALAASAPDWKAPRGAVRVLTPHPGEMARLVGRTVDEVQANRLELAQEYASAHHCVLVLKGNRTIIALPCGKVMINPTGSPAMAKGGTGDILTGLIAGLLAQAAPLPDLASIAAVWLHGRCGELGAAARGEYCLLATELLDYLPEAIRDASV